MKGSTLLLLFSSAEVSSTRGYKGLSLTKRFEYINSSHVIEVTSLTQRVCLGVWVPWGRTLLAGQNMTFQEVVGQVRIVSNI